MHRRDLLRNALASGGALAVPGLARAQGRTTLRFIPQADVAILDPTVTVGLVNRNHGFLLFDTLYGVDLDGNPQPQMVDGHSVSDDGRIWTMVLRDGLRFHDGTPVLARDAVASLRRWGARDAYAASLFAIVDALDALDDRTLRWRLKRPFPLLTAALGKVAAYVPFIMPERFANGDPAQPVKELVGSGPFRFDAAELVPGSRLVYQRFDGYVPRPNGVPSLLAGPKVARFDRVEWQVIPDPSTAAAALQRGEVDWWDQPIADLLPTLKRNRDITVEVLDPYGNIGVLRFNHTQPPFNNPALRRAILGAVKQRDFMTAVAGDDQSLWKDGIGFFAPGGIMANDVGMKALDGSRPIEESRRAVKEAGYAGERIAMVVPTDFPAINAMSEVAADLFRQLGMNLDYQAVDWGTTLKRMANREGPEKGGWNVMCNYSAGVTHLNPSAHNFLRGSGDKAVFGWPNSPALESLRDQWFEAPDAAVQRRVGEQAQRQAFEDVPYVPLGLFFQPTAYRNTITGVLKGLPLFWNVRRA